jgi:hypothetical protein
MSSKTNFVLYEISTTPVLIRLEDFCRYKKKHDFSTSQAVDYVTKELNYKKMCNTMVTSNKQITIYYPKEYIFNEECSESIDMA